MEFVERKEKSFYRKEYSHANYDALANNWGTSQENGPFPQDLARLSIKLNQKQEDRMQLVNSKETRKMFVDLEGLIMSDLDLFCSVELDYYKQ